MTEEVAVHEPHRGSHPRPVVWALGLASLIGLCVASVLLRTQAFDTSYWIDEGIATGIARYPLSEIPSVLLLDGSPPLYYLLLHIWEDWFGTGEAATRSLSLLAATLTIPVAFLFAWRIAGARAAWVSALLAAGHPFLTYYAQETRMYALVSLLALIMAGSLVLVFTQRQRRFIPLAIIGAAGIMYSHNWGLFAVAASFVAALIVVFTVGEREERRASVIDGVIIYGAIGVLYLPWVPSLLKQASSTGAPWSMVPGFGDLFSAVVVPFGYEWIGVVLAAITAAAALVIARRKRPGDAPTVRAALLLALIIVGTGVLAWVISHVSPAWSLRYLAVSVGPAILLSGLVLARIPTVGAAVLCLLALLWAQPLEERVRQKSNVAQVAALAAQIDANGPGDVVISPHPEQLPVISHYMGPEPRYATSLGWQQDTRVFDWRHAMDRLKAADPDVVWSQMRPEVESGQDVVLAVPILRSAQWRAPWTWLVRRRALQWQQTLDADPGLIRLGELPRYGDRPLPRGLRLIVYRKR
ncbi:MAG: glycosyltransferase family 39 protein [Solirubrobacteraceae bacterium]|nr:glycosyltransferase family 39 protein [Solirubrobacteraceae bacterium]